MLDDVAFDAESRMTGLEIELNLMDADAEPAMRNAEILANLADPTFQTELGQFNLELNARPRLISGDGFADYERDILESLGRAEDRAGKADCTHRDDRQPAHPHAGPPGAGQPLRQRAVPRCSTTRSSAPAASSFRVDIRGVERLQTANDSIAPEAACTSVQFHMQVPPERFAAHWNASQAIAGIQVAIGANSPYLHGRRLWAETRIALFEQATDTRPDELKAQGVRPRVWFGERWITSVFDLFEENVRYFPPLLPILDDEDPVAVLRGGGVPRLGELRLHNGTVYRWNRPVYDIMNGRPHLRVENRVLPAGPTVVDMLANAAFYFGLARQLAEEERPIWSQLPFAAAEDNFHAARAARHRGDGVLAAARRGAGHRPGAVDAAAEGARRAGEVRRRRGAAGPAARASSRSAAGPGATARPGRPRRCGRPSIGAGWAGTRRCTTCCCGTATLQHSERAGAHLAGRLDSLAALRRC